MNVCHSSLAPCASDGRFHPVVFRWLGSRLYLHGLTSTPNAHLWSADTDCKAQHVTQWKVAALSQLSDTRRDQNSQEHQYGKVGFFFVKSDWSLFLNSFHYATQSKKVFFFSSLDIIVTEHISCCFSFLVEIVADRCVIFNGFFFEHLFYFCT